MPCCVRVFYITPSRLHRGIWLRHRGDRPRRPLQVCGAQAPQGAAYTPRSRQGPCLSGRGVASPPRAGCRVVWLRGGAGCGVVWLLTGWAGCGVGRLRVGAASGWPGCGFGGFGGCGVRLVYGAELVAGLAGCRVRLLRGGAVVGWGGCGVGLIAGRAGCGVGRLRGGLVGCGMGLVAAWAVVAAWAGCGVWAGCGLRLVADWGWLQTRAARGCGSVVA